MFFFFPFFFCSLCALSQLSEAANKVNIWYKYWSSPWGLVTSLKPGPLNLAQTRITLSVFLLLLSETQKAAGLFFFFAYKEEEEEEEAGFSSLKDYTAREASATFPLPYNSFLS